MPASSKTRGAGELAIAFQFRVSAWFAANWLPGAALRVPIMPERMWALGTRQLHASRCRHYRNGRPD